MNLAACTLYSQWTCFAGRFPVARDTSKYNTYKIIYTIHIICHIHIRRRRRQLRCRRRAAVSFLWFYDQNDGCINFVSNRNDNQVPLCSLTCCFRRIYYFYYCNRHCHRCHHSHFPLISSVTHLLTVYCNTSSHFFIIRRHEGTPLNTTLKKNVNETCACLASFLFLLNERKRLTTTVCGRLQLQQYYYLLLQRILRKKKTKYIKSWKILLL